MAFLAWTSQVILLLLGLFLMIIVLLQRGRGGGLAGAFGGMGGQSAFGTKAGDVFTKITIVVALLWVITAGGSGFFLRAAAEQKGASFGSGKPAATSTDPVIPSKPGAGSVPAPPTPPASKNADADATTTPPADAGAPAATSEPGDSESTATDSSTTEPSTSEPTTDGESPSQN